MLKPKVISTKFPPSCLPVPSSKCQVPRAKVQSPSSKFQVPSSKFQAPSSKLQAPSSKFQAPSSKFQIPSCKFQAPSSKFQAPSCKYCGWKWPVSPQTARFEEIAYDSDFDGYVLHFVQKRPVKILLVLDHFLHKAFSAENTANSNKKWSRECFFRICPVCGGSEPGPSPDPLYFKRQRKRDLK